MPLPTVIPTLNPVRNDLTTGPQATTPIAAANIAFPSSSFDQVARLAGFGVAPGQGQSMAAALTTRPLDIFGGALMQGAPQMGLSAGHDLLLAQVVSSLLGYMVQAVSQMMQQRVASAGLLPPQFSNLGGVNFTQPSQFGPPQQILGQPAPLQQFGFQPTPSNNPMPRPFATAGTLPIPTDRREFESFHFAVHEPDGRQLGNVQQNRAIPGTRLASVQDPDLFDAVIARSSAYQVAATAKGFSGQSPDSLADGANMFYRMKPETQLLIQSMEIFKGDLAGGRGQINNAGLRDLLLQRGFPLANRPEAGITSIDTLGAVAEAMENGFISMQDIVSQPGLFSDPRGFQQSIDLVRSGQLAQMLNRYDALPITGTPNFQVPQIRTNGPTIGGVNAFFRDAVAMGEVGQGSISQSIQYSALSSQERTQMSGLDDRQRAILHLWGIQMGSSGVQDGGVYFNVLQNPDKFKPAEVEVAREFAAQEQAMFGGVTGKGLDSAFFGVYRDLTGKDISQRYGNAPIRFGRGPVDMTNRVTGRNGLSQFENEVLQLWGHSPLFGNGIDGSILDYSLNSANRLEVNLNNNDLLALKQADLDSDGVANGDSLEKSMMAVLDHVYLGGPQATVNRTMNDAITEASQRRQGLLPPPRTAASRPINPIGLNFGALSASCPFFAQGLPQPGQAQGQGQANGLNGPPVVQRLSPAEISY